jgi:hypothetical protein
MAVAVLRAGGEGVAMATTVRAVLAGSHEVPPVVTAAHGSAVVTVDAGGRVSGRVISHGTKATMVRIHEGAEGTNGPILIWLKQRAPGLWVVPPEAQLTALQHRRFLAGELYINVHSARHPAGELRGQLLP